MGYQVPPGWETVKLGQVADVQLGKMLDRAKQTEGQSLPYLRNINVRWGRFELDDLLEMPFLPFEIERFGLRAGDVLICEGGEPGRSAVWDGVRAEVKYQKALHRARPEAGVLPDWLFYHLMHDAQALRLEGHFTGTTIKHFTRTSLLSYPILLPGTSEQRRIVHRIRTLNSSIETVQARLGTIPALLNRFRQSVLAAAFRGDLTADWRAQNRKARSSRSLALALQEAHDRAGGHRKGNAAAPSEGVHDLTPDFFPSDWSLLNLRDLVRPDRPITYGILKPGPDVAGGIQYLRVADYPNERLTFDTIRHTSWQIDQSYKRSRLRGGDLLISIRGSVGRVIMIPEELEGANITQDSARLALQVPLNPEYVLWYLRSPFAQQRLQSATKGVAVRGINIGDLRALQVPLPCREEQDQIAENVRNLLSFAEVLQSRCAGAQGHIRTLQKSILARAFRGELVPQDPNEEPASLLLERIRAEREAAAANGKPKTRRKKSEKS